MTTKRVFVALDISEEARQAVAKYVARLRGKYLNVPARWLRPEYLHITLRFVGDVSGNQLAELDETVRRVAGALEPFIVTLRGTGNFAKRKIRADALWLGMTNENSDKQAEILRDIATRLSEGEPQRGLVPHLTLARIKDALQARDLVNEHLSSWFEPVSFTASELVIYESTLRPTGSVYSVLSKHQFGG